MRNSIITISALIAISALSVRSDLLDCEERKLSLLPEIGGVGLKVPGDESSASGEHDVRDFFKSVGCQIKKGATKVTEHAKRLGDDIKEGAKKLTEKAKDLGSEIKSKFYDFKEKITKDSEEDNPMHYVEIINPDILKAEQFCGHGHILDALGNCSKLRK